MARKKPLSNRNKPKPAPRAVDLACTYHPAMDLLWIDAPKLHNEILSHQEDIQEPPTMAKQSENFVPPTKLELSWYLVRLNQPSWPWIPVLAVDEEDAAGLYAGHCGLRVSSKTTLGMFNIVHKGYSALEDAHDSIPDTSSGDKAKSGGVPFITYTILPEDE